MSSTLTAPTGESAGRRWSNNSDSKEPFPAFEHSPYSSTDSLALDEDNEGSSSAARVPSPNKRASPASIHNDRWQPRKEKHLAWGNGLIHVAGPRSGHERQKSVSEAIRIIKTRKGSISANAHELADSLKAPLSIKLVVLCLVWYMSSALTNTSSKSILNAFPKPITLTIIQFAFVSGWCIFFAYLARLIPRLRTSIPALKHGIRYPTREVIATTLPLALFQIAGHILSSIATEKIPVSLVHTIKGLSPLFTVLAYRFIYHIHYATATYLSLIPLTFGVVLACSVEFSGNLLGILCAFGGALIFVTQNIFSKKLFNEAARAEADGVTSTNTPRKLDKLNLLCYCSGLAFLLTFPIWIWTDALPLYSAPLSLTTHELPSPKPSSPFYLPLEFFFNGVFHFSQNILAFILLSMVSPVTYSVASLIKRVFVIVIAIVWFGNRTTPLQAAGIALTFLGLYLYDRTSDSAKADRRARLEQDRIEQPLLPVSARDAISESSITAALGNLSKGHIAPFLGGANGHAIGDAKKQDDVGPGRMRSASNSTGWVPSGTGQEEARWPRDQLGRNVGLGLQIPGT